MQQIKPYLMPPSKAHRDLVKKLFDIKGQATIVDYIKINFQKGEPEQNTCHDNCDTWCKENPECKSIRGWLIFDISPFGFVRFSAHSVIEYPNKCLADITPSTCEFKYPFLRSELSENDYSEAIYVLLDIYDVTFLDYQI